TPSTRQCAGAPLAASTHTGADSVTLRTGSPIDATGMEAPRRSAVHWAGAAVLLATGCAAAALAVKSEIPIRTAGRLTYLLPRAAANCLRCSDHCESWQRLQSS